MYQYKRTASFDENLAARNRSRHPQPAELIHAANAVVRSGDGDPFFGIWLDDLVAAWHTA